MAEAGRSGDGPRLPPCVQKQFRVQKISYICRHYWWRHSSPQHGPPYAARCDTPWRSPFVRCMQGRPIRSPSRRPPSFAASVSSRPCLGAACCRWRKRCGGAADRRFRLCGLPIGRVAACSESPSESRWPPWDSCRLPGLAGPHVMLWASPRLGVTGAAGCGPGLRPHRPSPYHPPLRGDAGAGSTRAVRSEVGPSPSSSQGEARGCFASPHTQRPVFLLFPLKAEASSNFPVAASPMWKCCGVGVLRSPHTAVCLPRRALLAWRCNGGGRYRCCCWR